MRKVNLMASGGDPSTVPTASPTPDTGVARQPTTQGAPPSRTVAAWIRDLPQWGRFKPEVPNQDYQLLDSSRLESILDKYPPAVQQRIREDIAHLERDLMRVFRDRDHTAKFNQNRYRKFQILFIALAALATMVGSFQALALFSSTSAAPVWGFIETCIALLVTFLATLISRESPLQLWMDNRRRAEHLRREYFRYLVNLEPYASLQRDDRRRALSRRAADINRGMDPDQQRPSA